MGDAFRERSGAGQISLPEKPTPFGSCITKAPFDYARKAAADCLVCLASTWEFVHNPIFAQQVAQTIHLVTLQTIVLCQLEILRNNQLLQSCFYKETTLSWVLAGTCCWAKCSQRLPKRSRISLVTSLNVFSGKSHNQNRVFNRFWGFEKTDSAEVLTKTSSRKVQRSTDFRWPRVRSKLGEIVPGAPRGRFRWFIHALQCLFALMSALRLRWLSMVTQGGSFNRYYARHLSCANMRNAHAICNIANSAIGQQRIKLFLEQVFAQTRFFFPELSRVGSSKTWSSFHSLEAYSTLT